MRITRAYTITPEVKRILDTKVNKSDYVCRAVRKLHMQEQDFSLRDVSNRQLYAAILGRLDDTDPLRLLIEQRYKQESTS